MEIKYEITEEDYINLNLYHAKSLGHYKKGLNVLKVLLVIICVLLILALSLRALDFKLLIAFIVVTTANLLFIIRFDKIYEKLIRKTIKANLKAKDNSSLFGKRTMLISDNEIKITSKHITEMISKESIKDIKIYDDMILIYLSSVKVSFIPTRYLNEETKEELLKRLAALKENN